RHPVGEDQESEREEARRGLDEQHRADVERVRVRQRDAEDAEGHPGKRDIGAGASERSHLAVVGPASVAGIQSSCTGTAAGVGTFEDCQAHLIDLSWWHYAVPPPD